MGEEPETKIYTRGTRSAGDQVLRKTLRPWRPSVYALELYRSGLDPREAARRASQRLQRKSRQGRLSRFQNINDSQFEPPSAAEATRFSGFNPDSLVEPTLQRARRNLGAAKASDCEVSKSFCAPARRCYELRIPTKHR